MAWSTRRGHARHEGFVAIEMPFDTAQAVEPGQESPDQCGVKAVAAVGFDRCCRFVDQPGWPERPRLSWGGGSE